MDFITQLHCHLFLTPVSPLNKTYIGNYSIPNVRKRFGMLWNCPNPLKKPYAQALTYQPQSQ